MDNRKIRVTIETIVHRTAWEFTSPLEANALLQMIGIHPVTDDRKLTRVEIAVFNGSAWHVTGEWKPQLIAPAAGMMMGPRQ